jgi:hypothetical protein
VYLADAIAKLNVLLDSPVDDYSWVWKKYETSTKRKLGTMGFDMRMHTTPLLSFLNAMSVNEIKEYFAE